ncbi:hypothetical protein KY348_03415 [Candidatus Woesearchaeota archaeon]|nr:hypothetical protein [Candidatus Woesearchaeota archaeon]
MVLELFSFDLEEDKYVITLKKGITVTKGSEPQRLVYTTITKNSAPILHINSEHKRRFGENAKPVWSTWIHKSPDWVGREVQEFELNIHKDLERRTNEQGENVYIPKQHYEAILGELEDMLG